MAKILVIDDSPIVFKMIKRAVEPEGFELVGHAENGKIGLEIYEECKPDIVTLDITMPVMNGIEMATILFQKHPEAKVIMMSSMDDADLIETARNIGLRHYLAKPIDSEELVTLIHMILSE